jgi:hypothetical protein
MTEWTYLFCIWSLVIASVTFVVMVVIVHWQSKHGR